MTAATLLERFRSKGVEVRANGDHLNLRPASALSPEELAQAKALKPELLRLLAPPEMRPLVDAHCEELRALVYAYGHCTADVFRRAQVFRQQINTWAASGRFGFPVLVLPAAPAPKADLCVSCGCPIADGWRCATCLAAIYAAFDRSGSERG